MAADASQVALGACQPARKRQLSQNAICPAPVCLAVWPPVWLFGYLAIWLLGYPAARLSGCSAIRLPGWPAGLSAKSRIPRSIMAFRPGSGLLSRRRPTCGILFAAHKTGAETERRNRNRKRDRRDESANINLDLEILLAPLEPPAPAKINKSTCSPLAAEFELCRWEKFEFELCQAQLAPPPPPLTQAAKAIIGRSFGVIRCVVANYSASRRLNGR